MKKGKYVIAMLTLLMMSMGLSSCYVGVYERGPRRGYYNRGPHRHHYPHYNHGYYRHWR